MTQLSQFLFFLAFDAHTRVIVVGKTDDFLQLADDLLFFRNQLLLFKQQLLALLELSPHTFSVAILYSEGDVAELVFLGVTVPHLLNNTHNIINGYP